MVVVEPHVKLVLRQIGRVFRKDPRIVVIGVAQQDPATVAKQFLETHGLIPPSPS